MVCALVLRREKGDGIVNVSPLSSSSSHISSDSVIPFLARRGVTLDKSCLYGVAVRGSLGQEMGRELG